MSQPAFTPEGDVQEKPEDVQKPVPDMRVGKGFRGLADAYPLSRREYIRGPGNVHLRRTYPAAEIFAPLGWASAMRPAPR